MIQIRLSAGSQEELERAKRAISKSFTLCRLRPSEKADTKLYKAYLFGTLNSERSPREHREA